MNNSMPKDPIGTELHFAGAVHTHSRRRNFCLRSLQICYRYLGERQNAHLQEMSNANIMALETKNKTHRHLTYEPASHSCEVLQNVYENSRNFIQIIHILAYITISLPIPHLKTEHPLQLSIKALTLHASVTSPVRDFQIVQ